MVSTPSEFVSTPQVKGVALYAYHPERKAYITLPLLDPVSARRNYDIASECLDAADHIRYGSDAPRTTYTQRQPTSTKPGYSGFKSDKPAKDIALADTYAALYEHVRSSGTRIIGTNGYSFEVVHAGRMVVNYIVSHTVEKDASDFIKYVVPWSSVSSSMTEAISVNPHTQEVMLVAREAADSIVYPLSEWDEFLLNAGIAPKDDKKILKTVQEDELDQLIRRKSHGETLSRADFMRMVHLKQKREWEESPLYQKTKNNPLIQKLAAPNKAVVGKEVVNYDRGILDHPEAWHTYILDYILSMNNGDWFTVDDIDEVVRKSGVKLGRSERTQFMSMTAYLLKLVGEGLITVRGIEGLDVYLTKRDKKTTPIVSVESFTVVGIQKPVQTDIFELLHQQ